MKKMFLQKIRLGYFVPIIIFLVIILSTLKKSEEQIANIGAFSILLIFSLSLLFYAIYTIKVGEIPLRNTGLLLPALSVIFIYLFGVFNGGGSYGLVIFGQVILVFIYLFTMMSISWDKGSILVIAFCVIGFVLVDFVYWAYMGFTDWFNSYLSHKNMHGGLLFGLMFFPLVALYSSDGVAKKIIWVVVLAFMLMLLYSTNSRASWLSVLVVMFNIFVWNFITARRYLFKLYFIGLVMCLFSMTFIYPYLSDLEGMSIYKEFVQELTGASLFSGRDRLWPELLNIISLRPVIGHGAGALPKDFIDTELSSHNLYLQIMLQVGALGLTAFIYFLYKIWNIYWFGRNDYVVKVSAAFFLAVLVYQFFDISLTQNNLSLALLQWLIFAIGISRAQLIIASGSHVKS